MPGNFLKVYVERLPAGFLAKILTYHEDQQLKDSVVVLQMARQSFSLYAQLMMQMSQLAPGQDEKFFHCMVRADITESEKGDQSLQGISEDDRVINFLHVHLQMVLNFQYRDASMRDKEKFGVAYVGTEVRNNEEKKAQDLHINFLNFVAKLGPVAISEYFKALKDCLFSGRLEDDAVLLLVPDTNQFKSMTETVRTAYDNQSQKAKLAIDLKTFSNMVAEIYIQLGQIFVRDHSKKYANLLACLHNYSGPLAEDLLNFVCYGNKYKSPQKRLKMLTTPNENMRLSTGILLNVKTSMEVMLNQLLLKEEFKVLNYLLAFCTMHDERKQMIEWILEIEKKATFFNAGAGDKYIIAFLLKRIFADADHEIDWLARQCEAQAKGEAKVKCEEDNKKHDSTASGSKRKEPEPR